MEISQFLNTFQSASAALDKLADVLREEPTVPEPTTPQALRRRRRHARVRARPLRLPRRPRRPPRSRPRDPRGPDRRAGRHHRGRQDDAGQARHPVLRPGRGPVLLDGVDLRDLSSDDLRVLGRHGDPGELPVHRHRSPTTSASAGPGPATPTSRPRPAALGAHDLIMALPEGYETQVANRGGRLSAGQRQLVAFARAFLADPEPC